jgi:hypothetical protein
MTDRKLSDYTKEDGFDESQGLEQCPHCETIYSPNGGMMGPVFTQDGQKYDLHIETVPGDGPFFCESCFEKLDANQKKEQHKTLGGFQ